MKNRIYLFLVFGLVLIAACKKGYDGSIVNSPNPETFMAINKIELTGNNRLTTKVNAYWWGTSEKGFVVGYEVSIDSMKTWTYTTSTDSSILLTITSGSDTANINVFVRAIDNLGQKDLTPASLLYPVKNSAPFITINLIAGKKPIKSFPAVRFLWNVTDADGIEDISGFEAYLNDTNKAAFVLPSSVNDITIMADSSYSEDAFVFTGTKTKALDSKINGLKYNAFNFFYVRAFDRAGLRSKFIKDSIYIKKPTSKVLFVNAYLTSRALPQNFISTRIKDFVPAYDTLLLNEFVASNYTEQSPDPLTQSRVFSFFKNIIWISDEGATASTLSLAQQSTNTFFNNGGTLFMMCNFGSDFPTESESFGFTPIQRLARDSSGLAIRMNLNDSLIPYDNSWPALRCNTIISSVRPFFTQTSSNGTSTYDSLYRGELIVLGSQGVRPFLGQSNVVSKRFSTKFNKTDLILMSLPIQSLNGNSNANVFLEKILKNELGF